MGKVKVFVHADADADAGGTTIALRIFELKINQSYLIDHGFI